MHPNYTDMKKILSILLTSLLTISAFGQHRYHPINYSDYSENKTLSPSKQHRVGTRESAPLKCTGSPNVPVLLVQFSDKEFQCDTVMNKNIQHSDANVHAFYDMFCNGSDEADTDYRKTIGSVGYVKQYFSVCSDGQFTPNFEVVGPITLPKSWQYYGKDTSNNSKDVNLNEFYQEAIKGANQLGIDWKKFDYNNDNIVDFVFFIYAGEGQNSYGTIDQIKEDMVNYPEDNLTLDLANLIWPSERSTTQTIGSMKFGGYGCTNEMYYTSVDGIGTMCHELSHALGLPDLYDTNYKAFGLDYWDVMDAGNYCYVGRCPCEYSAYERDFMGWRKLETLSLTEGQTIRIEPIEKGGKGYKLVNPDNASEYYIIENRQCIGFDEYYGWVSPTPKKTYGANVGLLISHVDYVKSSWTSNVVNTNSSHQRLFPLPADGQLVTSIRGYTDEYYANMAGDLYPGSKKVTTVAPERFTLYTGGHLPTEITNIKQNADLSITVDLNGGDPTAVEEIISNESITTNASVVYDLSGRPVLEPKAGIYIKNGKKIFVK